MNSIWTIKYYSLNICLSINIFVSKANYNGWVEDFERSGGPFCVNVSLIQTLYDLLGNDLQATEGQLEVNDAGFTATAKLTCSKCR